MASPDRLEALKKIPRKVASVLDPVANKHTLLVYGGFWGFIGLEFAEEVLRSSGIDFGLPRGTTRFIAGLPAAYPIFRGVIGNGREYFQPSKALSLSQSPRDMFRMMTSGLSLHSAGEYVQVMTVMLGGTDFATSWRATSMQQFLFDPHNIPYWTLNVPGFFLAGKALVSAVKFSVVDEVIKALTVLKTGIIDPWRKR